METWQEVCAWRRATRAALLSRRMAVPREERRRCRSALLDLISARFPELRFACVGFCWPFQGEIDLRPLIGDLVALGAEAGLPVVVEKQRPLEFWAWRPHMKLKRGVWDIPVPTERRPIRPTVLLVPLVGFDAAGYRLGYGGGYYDRTLATMDPKPLTIGIGYEFGRLETIYPQPHDIPLDAIATEAGCAQVRYHGEPLDRMAEASCIEVGPEESLKPTAPTRDLRCQTAPTAADEHGTYASPPCFMHELAPEYLGYPMRRDT